MPLPVGQRSLDELGQPLSEVTFCIVDVETTGGSPAAGAVTEIGAVKLRGGECLGTFQSLINPGMPIPREITVLTGISAATVADAPPIRVALPGFIEFLGDAVFVGHNVRYDWSFLNAELLRSGLPQMANRSLDTLSLARRLVREEVPNCKLSTLAVSLRLDHQPAHRALDDALATGDLLHLLIERASSWGVLGLDDLIELPKIAGHPQADKLRLTESLPHKPGVYLFRDRSGRVLYVGKASDLRSRVRSYFTGDSRRKIGQLLRETHAIDHEVCHHSLEASVREIRLIHAHEPRYNRHFTRWRAGTYLRLTDEVFPRFTIVRKPPPIGTFHLGPLPSTTFANRVVDAVQSVVELRRCKERIRFAPDASDDPLPFDSPGRSPLRSPCAPAQLGIASCPCSGQINQSDYAELVSRARQGLSSEPQILLEPLARQLDGLAAQERFEEAVVVRDRGAVLAEAIRRQRRMEMWRDSGQVVVTFGDESGAALSHGVLTSSWGPGERSDLKLRAPAPAQSVPIAREAADELLCVASYMEHTSRKITLEHVDGVLASPLPRLDRFAVRNPANRER